MIQLKNARSRRSRLLQLEELVQEICPEESSGPISAPEWLDYYEQCSRTRLFDTEPDFKETLAEFVRVLKTIPPERHVPTEDFEPHWPDRKRLRIWHVRHEVHELKTVYSSLDGMCNRAFQGLAGVSKVEFQERYAWFKKNIDDLPMHYMIAEDGKVKPRQTTVETALYQGPSGRYALSAMLTLRGGRRAITTRQQPMENGIGNGGSGRHNTVDSIH